MEGQHLPVGATREAAKGGAADGTKEMLWGGQFFLREEAARMNLKTGQGNQAHHVLGNHSCQKKQTKPEHP